MNNIDIGISVNARLYLHVVGNEIPTQFDVPKIINVREEEGNTVMSYMQDNDCVNIIVSEKAEEVQEAINDALYYKGEALKRINELLEI